MPTTVKWGELASKVYQTGVDRMVLYLRDVDGSYPLGIGWTGITAITASPGGAEPTDLYADNQQYITLRSTETFGATIEAYIYPEEFEECDGSTSLLDGVVVGQQTRSTFGFCYRTLIGNEAEGDSFGYKLHLVYGATASPSEQANSTVGESPNAATLSWEVSTNPVAVAGMKVTSHIVIDSTKVTELQLIAIEEVLYGDAPTAARLPLPDEVKTIMDAAVI